ncbi:MAG: molecular chaperone TorD family protein [Coriobacteriales bacterium]|nr:molecular chaperone TorD family protein [Coriobacteriales bacterium]
MSNALNNDQSQLTLAEFAEINDRRASSYAFLSRLFAKEVDPELLDHMHNMKFPMNTGNSDTDEGNRLLAGYLSNIWDGTLQELAVDYVHTFIGSGIDAFSAAYPYESVYTSPKRLMMQEARDEVLAIYRSQGIEKALSWQEAEDHVAAELEFMAALATRTADLCREENEEAVTRLLRTQRGFLADHLYAWTGMLTADMRKYARTDFYKSLASLLDGLLGSDLETLNNILGPEEA